MSKYKLVIFDLDGTLLNTIGDIHNAINYSLSLNKLNLITLEDATRFIGNGVKKLITRTLEHIGINVEEYKELYEKVMADYIKQYSRASNVLTAPYEGIEKLIKILKNDGIKLSVLTNKPNNDAVRIVEEYFPNIFDYVQGAQEGIEIKPDPSGALKIIEHFGFEKEEVLFVGDSDVDILTARNCGVDSVGCLYGYQKQEQIQKAKSSYLISKPLSLLRFFEKDINGVLLFDKPIGDTSQEALAKIKKIMNIKKIGHAGTLDPLATGLLVALLGDATKLSDYLVEETKEYVCEVTIGKETATLDNEGEVTAVKYVDGQINPDKILEELKGENYLVPPMYSAIKVNGVKMYELARKGKEISLEARRTIIYDIERTSDIEYKDGLVTFEFWCKVSKGTYVRSLCKEIGKRLNYPAYMSKLRRIKSGLFSITEAHTMEDVEQGAVEVIPILDALKHKTIVSITPEIYKRVKDGISIYLKNHKEEFVFLEYNGKFVAIYELFDPETFKYKAKRVLK